MVMNSSTSEWLNYSSAMRSEETLVEATNTVCLAFQLVIKTPSWVFANSSMRATVSEIELPKESCHFRS
ncbi:hypothetical protein OMCYN_01064 [cyanobiont of Ornithocercus magnificus]|nr:hypothetical protein OMCYN_01064 [cyanobiont of Ornithocercus magnificus]